MSLHDRITDSHSLESEFPFNELLELVRPATCGLDDFGLRVDQVIFDEVQARLDVSILKLDEVQPSGDLLLNRYLVQFVASCFLKRRAEGNTRTAFNPPTPK